MRLPVQLPFPIGCSFALLLVGVFPDAAHAQSSGREPLVLQGTFGSNAGNATDQRGVRSTATGLSAGATLQRGRSLSVTGGASYTRFQESAASTSGQLAATFERDLFSKLRASVATSGSYTGTTFGQSFAAGTLASTLEVHAGGVSLFAGPRVQTGITSYTIAGLDSSGGVLNTPLGSRRVTAAENTQRFTVTGAGVIGGAQWQGINADRSRLTALSYRVESTPINDRSIIDHSAAATVAMTKLRFTISGGQRYASDERRGFASAQVGWALTRALTLDVGGGTYPANRITGAFGGSFLQAGVSWMPSRARRVLSPRALTARGVLAPAANLTRLVIEAPSAARVTLAGDWNDWKEVLAQRADNGVWYVDVPLARGEYRYAFRVDGQWRVPANADQVDDGFGGKSALLVVREQR